MLKTSNIKSMAQILRNMKHPPVEEDTDKDEPGTQGDKEEYQRKRKEIAKKFGVESCSALKDEEKRKACYAALDAAHVSDDEEEDEDDDPVGKNEEIEIDESLALQLKMAFDDAKIKMKSKKGKIVIAKRDKKKAMDTLSKTLPSKLRKYVDKAINNFLVFEEVELDEKSTAYPATVDTLRKIVKDKQHQTVMFDKGQALVDTFTASAMLAVYDAMKKPDIKKKFEAMIKSKEGFIKTQAFAMKMIK